MIRDRVHWVADISTRELWTSLVAGVPLSFTDWWYWEWRRKLEHTFCINSDHPHSLERSETNGKVRLNFTIKPGFLTLVPTRKSEHRISTFFTYTSCNIFWFDNGRTSHSQRFNWTVLTQRKKLLKGSCSVQEMDPQPFPCPTEEALWSQLPKTTGGCMLRSYIMPCIDISYKTKDLWKSWEKMKVKSTASQSWFNLT